MIQMNLPPLVIHTNFFVGEKNSSGEKCFEESLPSLT